MITGADVRRHPKAQVAPEAVAGCYAPYRPEGWTPALGRESLTLKLDDARFTGDLAALVSEMPADYDVEVAAAAAERVLNAIEAERPS